MKCNFSEWKDYVFAAAAFCYVLLEYWLGITTKTKAASLLELVLIKQRSNKMQTPFETKDLVERLKKAGLPDAEKLAKDIVGVTMDWTKDSLALSTNPLLKFLAPAIDTVKPIAMQELDKIDGVIGN